LPSKSPYGGLVPVTVTKADGTKQVIFTHEIPLPERFFMGGSDSLRAFSINQAGPRDPETGFPIGGNALFLNSLEFEVSIAQDRLGVVLFHDMGNVYSSIRRMRLSRSRKTRPLISITPYMQWVLDFFTRLLSVPCGLTLAMR